VAEGLKDFAYPQAVGILERLGQSSDMGIRLAAEESLGILRASLPDLSSGDDLAFPLGQGVFHKAYVSHDPLCGQYSVIYSRRAEDGSIRFCTALIDTWDTGLKDMWGNVCASDEAFEELVASLDMSIQDEEEEAEFRYEAAKPEFALFLLRRAEALTLDRGYDFPKHHALWGQLYSEEPDPPSFNIAFGLECLECRRSIQMSDADAGEMPSLIVEEFAVCGECLREKMHCANCGGLVDGTYPRAIPDFEARRVDLFCGACYDKMD
ncbi:MAG: hypothetical protein IID54_07415, partial [Proteobacteria bacterium]|nr:hypothetical protein [Pseudomonadota bacterium]